MSIDTLEKLVYEREQKQKQIIKILDVMKKYEEFGFDDRKLEFEGLKEKFTSQNIKISIVAEVSSGKSTFLNALIFKDAILESKIGETTAKLFHIMYGDEFSLNGENVTDVQNLKKAISKENSENLIQIENDQELALSSIESKITLPDENLKKGIELYDTPGFGTVNEQAMALLLKEAITKSDAVILLLDITQGLKKNEKKFVQDFLDNIVPNKRFIVLNKYDGIIDEDDLLLKDKEEIEQEIQSVITQTEQHLQELQKDKTQSLETFYLSARKALVGKKTDKEDVLQESRFEYFENKFWNRIVQAKEEIFEDNVQQLLKQKEILNELINTKKQGYEDDLKTLQTLLAQTEQIEGSLKDIVAKKGELEDITRSLLPDVKQRIIENEVEFVKNIEITLNKYLTEELEKIGFVSKLAFWSIKDKYNEAVTNALKCSGVDFDNNMESFLINSLKILQEKEDIVNSKVDEIGELFDIVFELNGVKIEKIQKIDFGFRIKDGQFSLVNKTTSNVDANDIHYAELESLMGSLGLSSVVGVGATTAYSATAATSFFSFGASKLLPIVAGPIGWGVAGVLSLFTLSQLKNQNKKVQEKILQEATPKITEAFENYIEAINDYIKTSSAKLTTHIAVLQERIAVIESSLEDKNQMQQTLEEVQAKVARAKRYIAELSNVR